MIEVSGSHPSKTATDGAAGHGLKSKVKINVTINVKGGGQSLP